MDVRIISATNQGLEKLVAEKRFRQFYRLNVIRLELPSLKDRRCDLPLLIAHIVKRLGATRNSNDYKISGNAMELLLSHDYPGNVRELENIIEHAMIICRDSLIRKKHLPVSLFKETMNHLSENSGKDSREMKRIVSVLEKHNWNKGLAAGEMNINRSTLWRKMKKYGIS